MSLKSYNHFIIGLICSISLQVQLYWHRFIEKIDNQVVEALLLNIKWSLQELLRAINSEGQVWRPACTLQGSRRPQP